MNAAPPAATPATAPTPSAPKRSWRRVSVIFTLSGRGMRTCASRAEAGLRLCFAVRVRGVGPALGRTCTEPPRRPADLAGLWDAPLLTGRGEVALGTPAAARLRLALRLRAADCLRVADVDLRGVGVFCLIAAYCVIFAPLLLATVPNSYNKRKWGKNPGWGAAGCQDGHPDEGTNARGARPQIQRSTCHEQ